MFLVMMQIINSPYIVCKIAQHLPLCIYHYVMFSLLIYSIIATIVHASPNGPKTYVLVNLCLGISCFRKKHFLCEDMSIAKSILGDQSFSLL